jgi:outer membrane protein assembly factor BamB
VRSKENGEVIRTWTHNASILDKLYDCTIVDEKLYVVGEDVGAGNAQWSILALDFNLNLISYLPSNPSQLADRAHSITHDGDHLYIAGDDERVLYGEWRIEKRRLDDLSLVKVYTSDPSNSLDTIWMVRINPITNHIWAVGMETKDHYSYWRIEILNKDLELIKIIEPGINGQACSVSFDENGDAYVIGPGAVIKFDKYGNEIKRNNLYEGLRSLYINNCLYVIDLEGIEGYVRHVLYVFDKNLELLNKNILSASINENLEANSGLFSYGSMDSDGKNLYVVGYIDFKYKPVGVFLNLGWIIYSIPTLSVSEKYQLKIEWVKMYGGKSDDAGRFISSDGKHLYVAGITKSFSAEGWDSLILKLDDKGSILWSRLWGTDEDDYAESMAVTSNSIYLLSGRYHTDFLKLNENGEVMWAKTNGADLMRAGLFTYPRLKIKDSKIFLLGSRYWVEFNDLGKDVSINWAKELTVTTGAVDMFDGEIYYGGLEAYKYSNNKLVWQYKYLELGYAHVGDYELIQVTEDGVYMVDHAFYQGQGYVIVIKTTHDGEVEWARLWRVGDSVSPSSIFVCENQIYVVGDVKKSEHSLGFILLLDKNGNLLGDWIFGGLKNTWFNDIIVLNDCIYIVGTTEQLIIPQGEELLKDAKGNFSTITLKPRPAGWAWRIEDVELKLEDSSNKLRFPLVSDKYSGGSDVLVLKLTKIGELPKLDVKFRGTVILVSPDYVDWKIKIEEILLDPIGELKVGEEVFVMAHNETFPNTGKPWVIGEPNVGDHVEVYGEYFSELTLHVWVHKSYHYIKKTVGEYPWPMFQHDNMRTGYTHCPTPDVGNVIWEFGPVKGCISAQPIIVNGKVLVGSYDKYIYCINETNGELIWRYQTDGLIFEPATSAYGKVFLVANKGSQESAKEAYVYCLSEESGALIWKYTLEGEEYLFGPAVEFGRVFVKSYNYTYCLSVESGELLWRVKTTGHGYIPTVVNGKVFIASSLALDPKTGAYYYGGLWCLDANNGEIIWKYKIGTEGFEGPVVASEGRIYARSGFKLLCLDENEGTLIWKIELKHGTGSMINTPAVDENHIFIAGEGGGVYCLDKRDGSIVWKKEVVGFDPVSPILTEDRMFVSFSAPPAKLEPAILYCLNKSNGEILWKHEFKTAWTSPPAIANNKVFIGAMNGYLYAFGEMKAPQKGSLTVTVYNHDGTPASKLKEDTWVELIRHGEVFGITQHIDKESKATFKDVEPGTYYINVWHKPPESVRDQEFWGQKREIKIEAGKTTTISFTRHMPIITQFTVISAPKDINKQASIEIRIKNIDSIKHWVKASLIIKDEEGSWIYSSEAQSKEASFGETVTFLFEDFKPSKYGSYYGYAICDIDGKHIATDQEGWNYLFGVGVDAKIISYSISKGEFKAGDKVSANVTIRNTGKSRSTFYVNGSVIDSVGKLYSSDFPYKEVTLNPGAESKVTLEWIVGMSTPAGEYDAKVAVWKGKTGDKLVERLDIKEETNAFKVVPDGFDYDALEWINVIEARELVPENEDMSEVMIAIIDSGIDPDMWEYIEENGGDIVLYVRPEKYFDWWNLQWKWRYQIADNPNNVIVKDYGLLPGRIPHGSMMASLLWHVVPKAKFIILCNEPQRIPPVSDAEMTEAVLNWIINNI